MYSSWSVLLVMSAVERSRSHRGTLCLLPEGLARSRTPLAPPSMGWGVKTKLPLRLTGLAPDGRWFMSRKTAQACRAWRRTPAWRFSQCAPSQLATRNQTLPGIPFDFGATMLSTIGWEPSFYWGLCGPALRSALRRGIAYPWELLVWQRPEAQWMLSCDSDSSPGTAPSRSNSLAICDTAPEASYEFLMSFAGS